MKTRRSDFLVQSKSVFLDGLLPPKNPQELLHELLETTRYREIIWKKDSRSMEGYLGERHLTHWRGCRVEFTFSNHTYPSHCYATLKISHPTVRTKILMEYDPYPENITAVSVPWENFYPLINEIWDINPPWE